MKPSIWLLPLSWLYGIAVEIRNWFFDNKILSSIDVGVPVISVGNITSGGTGKTPIVLNIVSFLQESSKKVAIISRGYGRKTSGTVVVNDGRNITASVDEAGDEAYMLAMKSPPTIVIVDEKRVRGAKKAISQFHADVIVLDDGFQHRYLQRTLDIVLVDAKRSPFRTALLPAGYRREYLRSIKRAEAIVVTKSTDENELKNIVSEIRHHTISTFFHSTISVNGLKNISTNMIQPKEMLSGHSVIAFSGIGSPESFEQNIVEIGGTLKKYFRFADHHNFTITDCEKTVESFHSLSADFIVTTEKDAVRLKDLLSIFQGIPLFALQIDAVVREDAEWKKLLLDAVR